MAPGYKSTTYPNAYRWSSTALLVFHYQSEMGSLKHHHGKAEEKLTNECCLVLIPQRVVLNATIRKKKSLFSCVKMSRHSFPSKNQDKKAGMHNLLLFPDFAEKALLRSV